MRLGRKEIDCIFVNKEHLNLPVITLELDIDRACPYRKFDPQRILGDSDGCAMISADERDYEGSMVALHGTAQVAPAAGG